jgi:D-glycero-alpha-D-manno-heptose-7-phosphate kinase
VPTTTSQTTGRLRYAATGCLLMAWDARPVIARAPVRISFGGGGTDLPAYYERFGGFVVSAAIARYCYAVAGPSVDGSVGVNSADYRCWERWSAGEAPALTGPLSLPMAVVGWFAEQGLLDRGVEVFTSSEVAPGSGLGSSSAMMVALIHALAAYTDRAMEPAEVAALASHLEIDLLRRPIGKQDQYASAFGGINAITFDVDGVKVDQITLAPGMADGLRDRLLLFSTGQTRDSATILDHQRAATVSDAAVTARLDRMKELAYEMRDALTGGDLDRFGSLLDDGWRLKRGLRGVSSNSIDRWYDAARGAGALGGKIAGAGGGGFLLLFCPPRSRQAVRERMAALDLRELVFDFDDAGAHVLNEPLVSATPVLAGF